MQYGGCPEFLVELGDQDADPPAPNCHHRHKLEAHWTLNTKHSPGNARSSSTDSSCLSA